MWLGVDGGGTKTEFVLFGDDMRAQARFRMGTCHPAQVGFEGMRALLAEGVEAARAQAGGTLRGVGLGLAGYGQEAAVRARMDEVARQALGELPFTLVSDVEAAWAACLDLADGIVVICGTGSIAFGRHADSRARAGGWGYQVGDEGSGYWLGRETLRLFSRQADGRDARGPLFDTLMERLALTEPSDIISYAHDVLAGDRTRIASLTRMLCDVAKAGDACALGAYERAAVELADLVRAVGAKLFTDAHDVPVASMGGVFDGAGDLLRAPLERDLPAPFRLVAPVYEPAAGAVLMLRASRARSADGNTEGRTC